MNPIPIEFQSLFRYEERWQVLICIDCGHGVISTSLIKHLRGIHQMKKKEYSPFTQAISSLPIIDKADDFPRPLNDSPPIDGIRIHQGYKCNHCDDMLTVNKPHMGTHIFNKHPGVRTSSDPGYQPTSLQAWIHQGKYWTVVDPNSSFQSSAPSDLANLDSSDGSTDVSIPLGGENCQN